MNVFEFYFQCIDTLIDQYCEQNCNDVSIHELIGVTWRSTYLHLYYRAIRYCMIWNGNPSKYLPILLLKHYKKQHNVSNHQYVHLFELRSSMRQSLILAYLQNKKRLCSRPKHCKAIHNNSTKSLSPILYTISESWW